MFYEVVSIFIWTYIDWGTKPNPSLKVESLNVTQMEAWNMNVYDALYSIVHFYYLVKFDFYSNPRSCGFYHFYILYEEPENKYF
jgi:hypothetical protein